MSNYNIIGIDLAKRKLHIAALNHNNELILSKSITREDFFTKFLANLAGSQVFAFEACGGCHYVAQQLMALEHKVIILKPKDVKAYARIKQKNDANDALAICRAALDPAIMKVHAKSKQEQEISYLHKSRQNTIQQRIQRSNALITSLMEFGFIVKSGKSKFAKECLHYVEIAFANQYISEAVSIEMRRDCQEIAELIDREQALDKTIIKLNKMSEIATKLETIPGIGPINASILSNKSVVQYKTAKDFAASLGLVPKQSTTGGKIKLGSITKQGDRYARTMLIQGARAIIMNSYKNKAIIKDDMVYQFAARLLKKEKGFNVACVAVANKLARIAYACTMNQTTYQKVI